MLTRTFQKDFSVELPQEQEREAGSGVGDCCLSFPLRRAVGVVTEVEASRGMGMTMSR